MRKIPNFFVIGAARSGTTSLHYYLAQHPQIYMCPLKEPNFFAFEDARPDFRYPDGLQKNVLTRSITDFAEYCGLFNGVQGEQAIGEVSPLYLYSSGAVHRIYQKVPDAKLMAILRNPVDRTFSYYSQMIRDTTYTPADFVQQLQAEEVADSWGSAHFLIDSGQYYTQLKPYFDVFGHDHLQIYLYEDLQTDPQKLLQTIYRFLRINETFQADVSLRYNASGKRKHTMLHFLIDGHNPVKTLIKKTFPRKVGYALAALQNRVRNRDMEPLPPFLPEVRQYLIQKYFKEDIVQLQDLIKRDLQAWLL